MPSSISDVMSALENLLLEHFKSINSGDATQPFLAFETGTAIPDETFRNPADTTKYSPALALEYLSHRSNAVPAVHDNLFTETSNTVEGLYELLLRGSTPVDPSGMELLGAIKRGAQAAFDETVNSENGIGQQFRPTFCDPVNWYDQSVASNWTPIKIAREDQPPPAPAASSGPRVFAKSLLQWNVAPVELRAQLNKMPTVAMMSSLATLQMAPLQAAPLAAAVQLAPIAPTTVTAMTRARMAKFNLPVSATAMTMNTARIDPAIFAAIGRSQVRQRVDLRRHEGIDLVVGLPAPTPPPPPPTPPVSGDSFSISVDVSIVKLRRPWLSDGLLNLHGWFVPSAPKGSFSDGTGVSDPGILPVLTVACVLIRNLAIHAQWSEDDRKNLENSTHLGAFGLQGRRFDHNSATLTVDGMQSVAWICDPLPVLPPVDAPAT